MDHLLRDFFAQDASYRSMRPTDQQKLFNAWARRNGIRAELERSDHQWVKFLRWISITISVVYLISLLPGIPTMSRAVVPVIMGLVIAVHLFSGRRLKLIREARHQE